MFSSTNQEDVKDYSVYIVETEDEVEKETYSMIPMYKNSNSNECWVILKAKQEDMESMKKAVSNGCIPNLKKFEGNTRFGFGVETFQKDIVEYYTTKHNYSYIEMLIDTSNILNTTTTVGFKRLEAVYKTLKSQDIICETDEEFFNQLNKISMHKYSGVLGLGIEGKRLFKGSRITEYLGSTIIIYDTSIIKEVRFNEPKK